MPSLAHVPRLAALAFASILFVGCGGSVAGQAVVSSHQRASQFTLETPDDLLAYMAAHPEQASLVAYPADRPEAGIYYRADEPQALASTVKILVLYAYARQVAEGRLDSAERVAVEDVFAYAIGRDGGAAGQAYEDWKRRGSIDAAGRVSLDEIVRALIRHSDNASTDYVMARLGRADLERVLERLGLEQEPPFPITGCILMLGNHTMSDSPAERLRRYERMSRAEIVNEAHRWSKRLRSEVGFLDAELRWLLEGGFTVTIQEQHQMCRLLFPRGTARGYSKVMAQIYRMELPADIVRVMRKHLEWPMALEGNPEHFDVFGTKGGSLPGILTGASYFKLKKQPEAMVSALFLRDLPAPIYESLSQSFLQQRFEIKLHADPAFFERARRRLSP